MLRVIIAEDGALLRQGVVRLLENVDDMGVVGEAADLPSLRTAVADLLPDVVVTDIRMPPTGTDEGIQASRWIAAVAPPETVKALTMPFAAWETSPGGRGCGRQPRRCPA